uniref:Exostosin GT47 domain-containing protein n=1 Tax=Rhizophora mucronata TaxID=61149 RepID=A0A2P2IWK1_RHIMU
MANTSMLLYYYSHRRLPPSFRPFFFIPTCLALLTSLLILLYISSTSNLFFTHHHHHPTLNQRPHLSLGSVTTTPKGLSFPLQKHNSSNPFVHLPKSSHFEDNGGSNGNESQRSLSPQLDSTGTYVNDELFHDKDIFLEDYEEMNRSFKIYVYPHRPDDPFAHALLPVNSEPGGNYASESYFKKALMKSHFITKNPTKADLFFMPFSIARLRHDPRIGVLSIQDFIRDYIFNISQKYPYWNRTDGADHFYVACHSVGRSAMEKTEKVKFNAIQVVCSSSYFLSGYIPHKDTSLPQIWPRKGEPQELASSKRKKLAFFAGSVNSPVREKLLELWRNDSEIYAHFGRLKTPYTDELLGSKFCLHVKGFEVNTARIADALYYGCVPVVIANHYDLPFTDILNWKSFSVVVATLDIPLLKKILQGISFDQYLMLQKNVLEARKYFQWHLPPVDYDAFHMIMYELWLRRGALRIPLSDSLYPSL